MMMRLLPIWLRETLAQNYNYVFILCVCAYACVWVSDLCGAKGRAALHTLDHEVKNVAGGDVCLPFFTA